MMKIPTRSQIRMRWKTVLLLSLVVAVSFVTGAFANLVVVQNIQSLAGRHVLVPAPELQILDVYWMINGSTVFGVELNVTTVSPSGVPVVNKTYRVVVQVSALDDAGKEFILSMGTSSIVLPSHMNATAVMMPVYFNPPVDPETVEVHDLSFIVTGTPYRP